VLINAIPIGVASYTITIGNGETFSAGAVTLANAAAILSIAGGLELNGGALAVQQGTVALNGGTVFDIGTLTGLVQGHGDIQGTRTLTNQGTIDNTSGNLFITAPLTNSGTIETTGVGGAFVGIEGPGFTNLSGGTLTGGTYIAQGSGGAYNILGITVGGNSQVVTDDATVILNGVASDIRGYTGGSFEPIAAELRTIATAGTLEVLGNRGFAATNALTDAGFLQLGGGTLSSPGLTVTGTLDGFGIVDGPVTNTGLIVAAGGALDITSPVTGSGLLTVDAGASLILQGAIASSLNDGGVVYDGSGLLDVGQLTGSGTLVVENGGSAEIGGAVNQAIVFGGANATLRLDDAAGFTGTLSGFGPADTSDAADRLILGGVSYTAATIVAGNTLQITGGGPTLDYRLATPDAGGTFSVVDSGGDTIIEPLTGTTVRDGLSAITTLNDQAALGTTDEDLILNDLTAALADWGAYVTGAAPLRISLTISTAAAGAELANGGYGDATMTGVTFGSQRVWEPASLYALTTGNYIQGSTSDINITLFAPGGSVANLYLDPTSNGTGAQPSNQFDLVSIFQHELAHGLGFIGFSNPTTGVVGSDVTMYDHYIQSVLNNGSIVSAAFTGPNAEAAYAALIGASVPTPVPLTVLTNGEALFHVANSRSNPLGSDLMNGVGLVNGTSVTISSVDLAMLKDVGLPVTAGITCYLRGTRIMTEGGEVPVERLQVGDHVVTAGGRRVPIIWIGQRHIDCRRHPAPDMVRPVRIRAHAFDENVPARDLLVSPNHAIAFEDVLIPARLLVNGRNVDCPKLDSADYFHVELPEHDLLLAEGLAAESYLDCGDRPIFANGGSVTTLFPDLASRLWECAACAELKLVGAEVERARAHLASRARTATRATRGMRSRPAASAC
jgi:hypothetical protein